MSEQKDQTNQSNPKPLAKIGGGLSGWLGALMGKPSSASKVPSIPGQGATEAQKQFIAPAPKDDSVIQDVTALKKLVEKVSGGVVAKVAPALKEGIGDASKAANTLSQRVGPSFITKALRIFFVLALLGVLVFIAFKVINMSKDNIQETEDGGRADDTTPTPVVYNPPKASIYASEDYILKLEEDINVMTQEISSTALREADLVPPLLDFNVEFK